MAARTDAVPRCSKDDYRVSRKVLKVSLKQVLSYAMNNPKEAERRTCQTLGKNS